MNVYISNEEFSKMAQAAGYEEGCEKLFGREINMRQCEACGTWGTSGELVYCTDDGDLCETHLGAFAQRETER